MQTVATTRMSSKGQIVIPEAVREQMNLGPGAQFVVIGEKDVVILKSITKPSMAEFDSLILRARRQARIAGMKKSDISATIARVRGQK